MNNINRDLLVTTFEKKIDCESINNYLNKYLEEHSSEISSEIVSLLQDLEFALSNADYDSVADALMNDAVHGQTLLDWLDKSELPDENVDVLDDLLELFSVHEDMSNVSTDEGIENVLLIFEENLPNILLSELIENGMLNEHISHYFDIDKFTREVKATDYSFVNVNAPNILGMDNLSFYVKN